MISSEERQRRRVMISMSCTLIAVVFVMFGFAALVMPRHQHLAMTDHALQLNHTQRD